MIFPHPVFKSALVLSLGFAVLVSLLLWQAPRYGELWVPLYRWEIEILAPELNVTELKVATLQGERVMILDAEARAGSVFSQYFFERAVPMTSSTLLGHVLLHPIVMLLIVLAWPKAGIKRKLVYALAAVPFLVVVELLDVPLVLLGSLQDLVLANTVPNFNRFAPMVTWMNLLNGGGRIALSVAAALLAIAVVKTLGPYLCARASWRDLRSVV